MADILRFDIAKDPKGNPITYGRVGDTDGLTRSVKVFEDGKPLDLTGYVITFEGNTSKYRTKVFDTGGVKLVDASKGEFTYTFPNMAFAVEGQYERAYFSFAKSDTRKTTGDFEIIVFGNSDIDADEAETIITEYNRLVAELHALQEQAIDDMNQNFAEVESEMEVLAQKISDTQAEIDRALAEFEAGNFYTKAESDEKLEDHTTNIENPHKVTKDQIGLGNVPNYAVATQSEAEAGTADDKLMTPFATKQNIDKRLATQEEVALGEDISKLVTPSTLAGLNLISLTNINIAVIDGTQGSVNTSTSSMNGKELGFGESVSFISQENVFANVDSSNHRLTVSEEGLYCLLAHVWVQPTGTVNGYWYLNAAINGVRAGGTDRMWGIGNTGWKNRQDGTGIFIKRLNAGDGISVLVETGYADAVNSAGIKSAILIKLA